MKKQMMTLTLGLSMLGAVAQASPAQQLASFGTAPRNNSVTIQNDRKVPATVYMEDGVLDTRLGTVPAMQTATLALPEWAVKGHESIQLFVHPEGEVADLATQTFSLAPPARIALIVPVKGAAPQERTDRMTAVIPPSEEADATLTVDNPRNHAVTIFAQRGISDIRLGQVPAQSQATLRIARSLIGPDESIQLFVHPEGGVDLSSSMMHVRRGEHLGLKVPLY
jgi:hypothetical protein